MSKERFTIIVLFPRIDSITRRSISGEVAVLILQACSHPSTAIFAFTSLPLLLKRDQRIDGILSTGKINENRGRGRLKKKKIMDSVTWWCI